MPIASCARTAIRAHEGCTATIMTRSTTDASAALRMLPAIDEVLRDPRVAALANEVPRDLLGSFAARAVDAWRAEIRGGGLSSTDVRARLENGELAAAVAELVRRERGRGVRRAVNATGVVLNTGLGRAPVHPEVARAMAEAAGSYCVLEVDRESGERNERDAYLGELLARLTGGEAGIAVNNNAGAVLLAFQTFAGGREAIVSRGELVEIGGSFRVPDVMARANARLVEVGTTNRTRIQDYRAAITPHTGLLMKVHTSNFRVVGFVEEVSARDLAELGRERGIATAFDLGSGLVECPGAPPLSAALGSEPLVRDAVASGVDCVMFSGDKLLGAPQAGLIVGAKRAVEALRKNPIYRALRIDKVALAGLESTCELLLAGRGAEIPARAMLALGASAVRPKAELIARSIGALAGFTAAVAEDASQPGSGSAPGVSIPTFVVRVTHARLSAGALAARLRAADVPVFARVSEGALLVDPRTLLAGDEDDLLRAFQLVAGER
jgi:L-seryl-tRNA(Ser) seleniumtransferase